MSEDEKKGNVVLFPGVKKAPEGKYKRDDSAKDNQLKVSDSINRIGQFTVNESIQSCVTMAAILAVIRFVPTNVRFDYSRRLFFYEGYSPGFDAKTNIYDPNPEYFLSATGSEEGSDLVVNIQRKPTK